MAEFNAKEMLQALDDSGFLSPHPAGEIVSRTKTLSVKRFFGLINGTEHLEYFRLWIGGKEYRDFDTREEAECARVLRGLPCLK